MLIHGETRYDVWPASGPRGRTGLSSSASSSPKRRRAASKKSAPGFRRLNGRPPLGRWLPRRLAAALVLLVLMLLLTMVLLTMDARLRQGPQRGGGNSNHVVDDGAVDDRPGSPGGRS